MVMIVIMTMMMNMMMLMMMRITIMLFMTLFPFENAWIGKRHNGAARAAGAGGARAVAAGWSETCPLSDGRLSCTERGRHGLSALFKFCNSFSQVLSVSHKRPEGLVHFVK